MDNKKSRRSRAHSKRKSDERGDEEKRGRREEGASTSQREEAESPHQQQQQQQQQLAQLTHLGQFGSDTVIVYDSANLFVDTGGRLVVGDGAQAQLYDVKQQEVRGGGEGDSHSYEIVHFVQTEDQQQQQQQQQQQIETDAKDADAIVDTDQACWLTSKYDYVVRKLQLDYGAGVKLLHSSKGVLKCVYFTTPTMQQAFNAIPQFLCIVTDISFKTAVVDHPELVQHAGAVKHTTTMKQTVSLILAEDGNGRSIIVSAGISTVGNNIRWLMETFKSCNPAWRQVRCVIVEPGQNAETVKNCFVGAHVCCNAWQASRWAMKYSVSDASLPAIRSYVDAFIKGENPDSSKIQGMIGARSFERLPKFLDKENLINFIHNGVEKIVDRFEGLEATSNFQPEEFVTLFFDIVKTVEEERRTYALSRLQETINSKQSPTDTLTQYAYYLIHQQTSLAQQGLDHENDETKQFSLFGTSTQECCCLFGRVFRLPCRHILMLTSELKVKSHIPFELRWTVYHCLFGCEIEESNAVTVDQIQPLKQEYFIPHREAQVVFCTPTSSVYTPTSSDNVQYIKAEPTTQPA